MVRQSLRPRDGVPPARQALFKSLNRVGGRAKALIIGCCSSHLEPSWLSEGGMSEWITCRNAGAMVPVFGEDDEGIAATVEYAVLAAEVRDIVVAGHIDCAAMGPLLHPSRAEAMPHVTAWLAHANAALEAVASRHPDLDEKGRIRELAMVNVALQVNHLRTHPSVAAAVAESRLGLHGWFFDAEGRVLVMDDESGAFMPLDGDAAPLA